MGRGPHIARQALALLIGIAGGALADFVSMPLPWMLGSMLATTAAAVSGLPILSPAALRPVVTPVIGVLLGSSVTLAVLRGAVTWLPSMLLLPVMLAVSAGLSYRVYTRVGGYDRTTAWFASAPGGLNEMILIGNAFGGDERRIALAHGSRVLFTVSFIGLWYGLVLGVSSASGGGRPWVLLSALRAQDLALLAGCAILGAMLGHRLRIPAGVMFVPMILSSLVHVTGLSTVPPPTIFVIAAQVVLGSVVGARFAGVSLSRIRRDALLGLSTAILMLASAVGFAELSHLVSGIDTAQALLAYAPGGLTEMSLLALAMGESPAFVSVTHIVRLVMVIASAPLIFRKLR